MDIGKRIRRAIRNQQKIGIQIVEYDFGVQIKGRRYHCRNGFCCPIGAMLLEYQPRPGQYMHKDIEKMFAKFGKDKFWIMSFIEGVDGNEYSDQNKRAFKLGRSIRKEFQVWR